MIYVCDLQLWQCVAKLTLQDTRPATCREHGRLKFSLTTSSHAYQKPQVEGLSYQSKSCINELQNGRYRLI